MLGRVVKACLYRTEMAMDELEQAEKHVIAALEDASAAFKALSSAHSSRMTGYDEHAEKFLSNLASAQRIIRGRISALSPDIQFENGSYLHLLEADLAMRRLAHVHKMLQNTLADLRTFPVPAVKAKDISGDGDTTMTCGDE